MPQTGYNVDNTSNTVIMKGVTICMKSSLKKKKKKEEERLITVPISHVPLKISHLDKAKLGCLHSLEDNKQLLLGKRKKITNRTRRSLWTCLSVPITFMHSLCFLYVCSHVPLSVEKYKHDIYIYIKKKTMTNIGVK